MVDILQRPKYLPPLKLSKTGKRCPMTIALGMRCAGGIVIAADELMTSSSGFKYEEEKISALSGPGWSVLTVYSGHSGLIREVLERVSKVLEGVSDVDLELIRASVDQVLTERGRDYAEMELGILFAIQIEANPVELLKFDGKALHTADDFNCLGVGDSALIRYLSTSIYARHQTLSYGKNLAIYLIGSATKYIRDCGGSTDVAVLGDNGSLDYGTIGVAERAATMERAEQIFLRKIVETAKPWAD